MSTRFRKSGDMRFRRWTALAAGTILVAACMTALASEAPVYGYRVLDHYPHDPAAFTQGLAVRYGVLFESTGEYGKSSVRRVALASGRVQLRRDLPQRYFGEGLALAGERLYQLTWRAGKGFIYRADTLTRTGAFHYAGEGWGLVRYGAHLILSDGSHHLRFLALDSLQETHRVTARDGEMPIDRINELEMVNDDLYANIWGSDRIAILDPAQGRLRAWLDLSGLLPKAFRTAPDQVLNGIAYDAQEQALFVTGKRWPRLYRIEVVKPP